MIGRDRLESVNWWRALAPDLHVNAPINELEAVFIAPAAVPDLQSVLDREGYLHLLGTHDAAAAGRVAHLVASIHARGLPAVFAFVFDQVWWQAYRMGAVIEAMFGAPYQMMPAFWSWHVSPSAHDAGWGPHRDRNYETLFPDRRPKSLTIWIPFTEATPLNGCMYCVPAHRDPTYGAPNDWEQRFNLHDVRALPGRPGDSFMWNQALLHWGSRSSDLATDPRISMAVEFQRSDVPPFEGFTLAPLTRFTFEQRLALIAMQLLNYRHMYDIDPDIEAFALRWAGRLHELFQLPPSVTFPWDAEVAALG